MDKQAMVEFWDQLWSQNMWFPGFDNSFKDLTPEQAAWKPAPARHSIWQNLNHICFWREAVVGRLDGKEPAPADVERRNFEGPAEVSAPAWRDTLARFARSQKLIRDALEAGKLTEEKFKFIVPHDAYHVGQAMYVRAMQGLPDIKYE